jgi:hypothetical protein
VTIRAIRDFDIQATSSPAAAAALAHADDPADPNDPDQPDDNDDEKKDDDEEDDDLVDVALPAATAQSILWKIPIFLWAVATDKIGGCDASIADSLPVDRWCASHSPTPVLWSPERHHPRPHAGTSLLLT